MPALTAQHLRKSFGVQVVLDSILEVEDTEKPSCVAQVVYRYYR